MKGNRFFPGFLKKQQRGKSIIFDDSFEDVDTLDKDKMEGFYKKVLAFDNFLSAKLSNLYKEKSSLEKRKLILVEESLFSFQNYLFSFFFEEFFIYFSLFIFSFINIFDRFLQKDLKAFFFS